MQMHTLRALGALALTLLCAQAAAAAAPAASAGSALSVGSIVQALAGLAAVLALVVALAWALRRYSGMGGTGSGLIRVISATAVGQRERVVLVEVGDTWLLLGVAPGQVRALQTLPKAESAPAPAALAVADQGFAGRLRRMLEKRGHA